MPATLSIVTNVFEGRERAARSPCGRGGGLGIILGPVIGGWLLEHYWWGSIFLINVFVVIVAVVAGAFLVPESKDPKATPPRSAGCGALDRRAGCPGLCHHRGAGKGWTDPVVVGAFIVAAVVLSAFLWWEAHTEHPMLQLSFFDNPRFSAASIAITLVFFAMFGTVFLNTQYLQFVLGYTPLEAGLRVMPVATMIVAAPLSARLTERFGTKVVVASVSRSLPWHCPSWPPSPSTPDTGVAVALAILGAGMGTAMAPATDSIMGSLPLAKAGVGSAMNDTTRQIGGALGVAILGSILASSYGAAMDPVVSRLPGANADVASDSIGGAAAVAVR